MASATETRGKISQTIAIAALMANGWITAEPSTEEAYDIVGRNPVTGAWANLQVKTLRLRPDKPRGMYIDARRSDGRRYDVNTIDYFVGVLPGDHPKCYLVRHTGLIEYGYESGTWIPLPLGGALK